MRNKIIALMLAGLMAFSSVVPTQAAEISTAEVSTASEISTAPEASTASEVSSVAETDEADAGSNSEISETSDTEASTASETSSVTESEETDISNDADSEENSVIEQEDTALSDEAELEAASETSLSNPQVVDDSSMTSGQKVTWDCVWFGSYPQTEIVANASDCGTYGKDWSKTTDYEVNERLYNKLSGASGWNSNGDITLSGIKYRRVQKTDATYSKTDSSGYYDWSNSSATYHYFRYEPIKWRVLNVNGSQALLLADEGLDDQKYNNNTSDTSITWEKSTIRSWLNGYGSSANTYGTDYSSKNFMDTAFTSGEHSAVLTTELDNSTTGYYSWRLGGNITSDKVFLLSSYDLYNTDNSATYGFYKSSGSASDKARGSQSSTYAKTMGIYSSTSSSYLGFCCWWLRSPGNGGDYAALVNWDGYVYEGGVDVRESCYSVRPALNLNLSSSDLYSYAGTVCSDGTINEVEGGNAGGSSSAQAKELSLNSVIYSYGGTTVNVLKKAYSIESSHDTFELKCTAAAGTDKIKRYELYYGKTKIGTSKDGNFSVSLSDIDGLKVSDKNKFRVDTVGANDTLSTELLLTIKDKSSSIPDSISFLGDGITMTVDEDFPLIGGDEISVNLPSLPVSTTIEDGKIKIGINLSEKTIKSWETTNGETTDTTADSRKDDMSSPLKWIESTKKEFQNCKDDFQKTQKILNNMDNYTSGSNYKAKVPGMKDKVKFSCVGYLEGTWSDSSKAVDSISGELLAVLSWSETYQKQSFVTIVTIPVPVTIRVDGKLKGSLSGKATWDLVNSKLSGQITSVITAALEVYGGLGYKDYISGGVYGGVELGTDITWVSSTTSSGVDDVTFYGDAGIKGYFAKKEAKWTLVSMSDLKKSKKYKDYITSSGKLKLWSREGKSLLGELLGACSSDDETEFSACALSSSDPDEIAESLTLAPDESSEYYLSAASDDAIVSNVYGGASPQIVTAGDNTVLVYADNDSDRSGANQTAIMYRIYDKNAGTFSAPKVVYDDGTADYQPKLVTNGTDIYVSYLNSSKQYGESEDPETDEYLGTFGVSVAKFENGAFKDLGTVSKNNCACLQSAIAATENGAAVIWTENSDNAVFGLSENNSVYYTEYNGSSWSDPKALSSGKNSIGELALGEFGGTLTAAYTEDEDNDLTTDTQKLTIYNLSDESSNTVSSAVSSLQFTPLPNVSEENVLAYNNGGGISYLTSAGSDPQNLTSEGVMDAEGTFCVDGNAIYYLNTADKTRNIGVLQWNGEKWLSTALTEESNYVDSFSISNGMITYLLTDAELGGDEEVDTSSSIKFLDTLERTDLALEQVEYNLSDTAAGAELPVTCTVANHGTKKVSSVTLAVSEGGSEVQNPVTYDVEIEPGESADIYTTVKLPEELAGHAYKVTVSGAGTDADAADNSYDLALGRTEISVAMSYEVGDNRVVKVTTTNESCVATSATTVVKDADGNEVLNKTDTIDGNSSAEYEIEVTDDMLNDDGTYAVWTAEVSTDDEEYYTSNNYTDQAVWDIEAPEVKLAGGGTDSSSGTSSNEEITWGISDDGLLYVEGNEDGVLEDPCWAAETAEKVTDVVLDDGVTKLGDKVISDCTNLEVVTIQNDNCEIEDTETAIPSNATIRATYGSTAYEYAKKYNRTFEALDEETHTHLWGEGTVITEATTENNGEIEYTCEYCNETKTETVHALGGHVYVERASECKASTCSKAGVKVSYCKWCGDKQEESLPIKAHTIVADKAVAATVFKTGKTAGKHCSVCKKVITAQKTIAKLKPTIKLSKTSVTVKKKKTVTIKVSKLAKGDAVKSWKTSNKKIATVTSKGVIKGVKKGKATITVTLKSGKKATVKVTVK